MYENIIGKRGLRQGDPIFHLLFLICMEYLRRIMQVVVSQEEIYYPTICKSLQLNHLCFIDDDLLFNRGDFHSVLMMLRGLKTFLNSSGLYTNAAKSNIFSANMEEPYLEELCNLTGYKKGSLPFRYLGVPISAKKISSIDCYIILFVFLYHFQ